MVTLENRYGDKFTFIVKDFETIEVKGNFSTIRVSTLLDYSDEYNKDDSNLDLCDFIVTIGKGKPTGYYNMIDPPGGPYLFVGMNLGNILSKFHNLIVTKIKVINEESIILNYYIE